MKVLVACEESQEVCKAFRAKGHEAYSCDILDCSGGHPEWHIKGDVIPLLNEDWDMIIAFPPCTHLAVSVQHGLTGLMGKQAKRKDSQNGLRMHGIYRRQNVQKSEVKLFPVLRVLWLNNGDRKGVNIWYSLLHTA